MTTRTLPKRDVRGFSLTIHPEADAFAVTLHEQGTPHEVATANRARMRDVAPAVTHAVRASGHARTTLHARRKNPIPLEEEHGVRLALALFATDGVRKATRKATLLRAVADMAAEEAYYWYAKCVGDAGPRVRRALRLFLAEE